jgi:hypothetical protein
MSESNCSNTQQTSNLNIVNINDENSLETLTKFMDNMLTDIKKCLDKVLDLRGKYIFNLLPFKL